MKGLWWLSQHSRDIDTCSGSWMSKTETPGTTEETGMQLAAEPVEWHNRGVCSALRSLRK
jgi:hypothetical protein